jgi:ankyrin repeat protein
LNERVRALLEQNPGLLDLRSTLGEYGEKPPSSFHIYMWTIGASLSPLQVAAQFGHQDTVEVMRAFATPRQRLMVALSEGNAAELHAMLRQSPDLLQQLTPEDQRILPQAAWAPNPSAVELMLELGFDPRTPDGNGATALHCAAFQGSAECVRDILRYPAASQIINLRDPQYQGTPLGWCCYGSCHGPRHADHAAVARMLLAAGARPDDHLVNVSDAVRAVIDAWRASRANA